MLRFAMPICNTLLASLLLCGTAAAQAVSSLPVNGPDQQNTPTQAAPQASSADIKTPNLPSAAVTAVTLPAGTKVLMSLLSPLHTTSAVTGSGIYLETVLPVVQGNHLAIPVKTQVLGVVDAERRPGRVKGRAQFAFHFTNLVFANNYVAPIDGVLQSVPGNKEVRIQDAEGTIEPVDQIDRDVVTVAKAAGAGFVVGSVRAGKIGATEHSAIGAAIGAGLGLGKVLFTRGDEIQLGAGTLVEMVLQRPISIELVNIPNNAGQARSALPEANSAPISSEPRPVPPRRRRPGMVPPLWQFLSLVR